MAKKPFKKERLIEKLQNEINIILKTQLRDPIFKLPTVTKVEINNDYSHAQIYWDTYDSSKKEVITEGLKGVRSKIRSMLSQKLSTRTVPALEFLYDGQYESEEHISKILQSEADIGKKY